MGLFCIAPSFNVGRVRNVVIAAMFSKTDKRSERNSLVPFLPMSQRVLRHLRSPSL